MLVDVRYVWHTLKKQEQNASLEHMTEGRVDQSGLKAWRKNPDKYAVLELVSQGVETKDIIKTLKFTEDELDAYHPIFREEGPSEKEMEEAYQKMLMREWKS